MSGGFLQYNTGHSIHLFKGIIVHGTKMPEKYLEALKHRYKGPFAGSIAVRGIDRGSQGL